MPLESSARRCTLCFAFAAAVGAGVGMSILPGQVETRRTPRAAHSLPRLAGGAMEIYVGPHGRPDGAGTRDDPWDLPTALNSPSVIPPGSVVWLLGGTYGDGLTSFTSRLTGTAAQPVIIRQVPGERATIRGSLNVEGAYAWYWGFEVMSPIEDRTGDRYNPHAGTQDGVIVNGPFTRFINLVIHDAREGIGLWTPAEGAEVHGCIIYNNGWQGPDRGHGHGIYTQNKDTPKHLGDNIIFNQFAVGIHVYGSAKAFVRNYLLDHNVVFNNGALSRDGRTDNLFVGSGGSVGGVRVEGNYTYHTPSAGMGVSRIGWQHGGVNQDVAVIGNYFIGGYIALEMHGWTSARVLCNATYAQNSINVNLHTAPPEAGQAVQWDGNRHFGNGEFYRDGRKSGFPDWQAGGVDTGGSFKAGRPAGVWTFVRPNAYEKGRGHIVVYNWDLKSSVRVDVSKVLVPGAAYRILDAQNIFGPPVLSGTYEGEDLCIPMTDLTVALPLGVVPNPPRHTAPEFGVFVIVQE